METEIVEDFIPTVSAAIDKHTAAAHFRQGEFIEHREMFHCAVTVSTVRNREHKRAPGLENPIDPVERRLHRRSDMFQNFAANYEIAAFHIGGRDIFEVE